MPISTKSFILASRNGSSVLLKLWGGVGGAGGGGLEPFSKKELIIASGQLIFWLVKTIFYSIFQRLLPVYFRLVETMFQENPSFQLLETDNNRANNGFRKKKEKL